MTNENNPIPLITPDNSAAHSGDVAGENVATLMALFPQIVTDGKVDFDVLRQLLGDAVEVGEERYGLNWKGKAKARAHALTPTLATLRPAKDDSVDWNTTQNLIIEGDNLEVLKTLRKAYAGKVKLIYIDPPYNTGKDFVYPDNYTDSLSNYLALTGQRGVDGACLTSNSDTSGRFHTDWLNMMYPRLLIARELLRKDGFIFISADQNEIAHVRKLCDELFGEENRAAEIAVVNNLKGRNDRANIAITHEFLVAYSRDPSARMDGVPLSDEQKAAFKFRDNNDEAYALRDLRKRGRPDRREDRPNMWFPIYWNPTMRTASLARTSDDDVEITPQRGDGSDGRWRWGKERVARHLAWLEARSSKSGHRWDVEHRVYLNNIELDDEADDDDDDEEAIERSVKPKSIWQGPEFSTDTARRTVKELMPEAEFSYPKAVPFIERIIQLGMGRRDIIVDFFAGSGTTGHAIWNQNVSDGGNRRFVLVQLPEPLDPQNKEQKEAAIFCDKLGKPRNIAELTKERLRRAGAKIKADYSDVTVDTGFRVYKLDSSNLKPWQPDPENLEASLLDAVSNIMHGRSEEDLLVELLLKTGIDLTTPAEVRQIAGKDVHALGGGALIVCLADINDNEAEQLGHGLADWQVEIDPAGQTTFYFKDTGFASASAKANVAAILRQRLGDKIAKLASI